MTTPAPLETRFNPDEPIPGYRLIEKIGAGGYGEVWKASAPGGLHKAVKLIFGHRDERRAEREHKALERIKQVRHPFLLSLERIEVVDGRLLIVSELADGSLNDRFEQCRQAGQPGVPRDELLGYMRDTADTLDYLSSQCSLQHLDVKPENLLLMGGHVKVADFGLVKDLQDVSASMVEGLTPVYASPELFDGSPNRHSDQYSLAIVYQQMLTGELPFSGRSAAQLASQHLHSRPDLSRLSPGDRRVIGRALAKSPHQRFESCRALVEALIDPTKVAALDSEMTGKPAFQKNSTLATLEKTDTVVLDTRSTCHTPGETTVGSVDQPIITLPPVELGETKDALRPTVVLAVGGLAGSTLRRLRARLEQRVGSVNAMPAVQLLAIDTSCDSLNQLLGGDKRSALDTRETLATTLRSPAEYRSESRDLLRWLSRRWLYNIPRSLQTEGLRPLGRLAMVDHAETIKKRISDALRRAVASESAIESNHATGRSFTSGPPRVIVVSSISGGTGSGMTLDVAYLMRHLMSEQGFANCPIQGVLMHATERRSSAQDLATANAYAFLTEMRHYCRPGQGYPGNPACGVPATEGEQRPFDDAYLLHLGEKLNDGQVEQHVDKVAEYLFHNTFTPAQAFFDACRNEDHCQHDSSYPTVELRTAGLCEAGAASSELSDLAAEALCRSLVRHWNGQQQTAQTSRPVNFSDASALVAQAMTPGQADQPQVASQVERCLESLGLSFTPLVARCTELLAQQLDCDLNRYLDRVLTQFLAGLQASATGHGPMDQLLAAVDALVGVESPERHELVVAHNLQDSWVEPLNEWAQVQAAGIDQWTAKLANDDPHRLLSTSQAIDCLHDRLAMLEGELGEALNASRQFAANVSLQLHDPKNLETVERKLLAAASKKNPTSALDSRFVQYGQARLELVTLRGAYGLVKRLQSHLNQVSDRVRDLQQDLKRLGEQFQPVSSDQLAELAQETNGMQLNGFSQAVTEVIANRQEALVTVLDRALQQRLYEGQGALGHLLFAERGAAAKLVDQLRTDARGVVREAIREIDLTGFLLSSETAISNGTDALTQCLELAKIELATCGGAQRLLLVLPQGADAERIQATLAERHQLKPTLVKHEASSVVFCFEGEQLQLDAVARKLVSYRPDLVKLASRVHTRADVQWSEF